MKGYGSDLVHILVHSCKQHPSHFPKIQPMNTTSTNKTKIKKEEFHISLHLGILIGRCILLCLLFVLTIPMITILEMKNTSLYLFIILLICPLLCSGALNGHTKTEHFILQEGAKHFLYSTTRYISEKYCCALTLLLMAAWQYSLLTSDVHTLIKVLPLICTCIYTIFCIFGFFFTRRKLKKYYLDFLNLK